MYFIYNPHAGMERIRSNLLDIIDIFVKSGYEVTVYPTQNSGDAVNATVNMKPGYDMLVCSGGDGTLDEVVAGMMQREDRIPIGYVPAGSTNDFAKTLKIPRDMRKAAEVVTRGVEFRCDMGAFNDRTFVYVAAFGLFTDISYGTEQNMKNTFGHLAYIIEAMSRIGPVQSYRLKIEHDGIVEEDEYVFGMVSNTLSVAGLKSLENKGVLLDDGLFEVSLIKMPDDTAAFGEIAAALVNDTTNDYVSFFRTSEISFTSDGSVDWTLDGEFGGSLKEVKVRNCHKALTVMVPQDAALPRQKEPERLPG
ncbi:MAG: YegS/Rv2252/BmrU family lipid kinase [Lachnospiraceae bacterium]|nr:YegS/Rv2252/BmrU family lipid kinase [Lachnospiraceae bacterium]